RRQDQGRIRSRRAVAEADAAHEGLGAIPLVGPDEGDRNDDQRPRVKLSILRLIPRRLVRDALLPTERAAAMAAALSKIFAKNPEHPFAKIAAVEFNRLARLYEVEKRRIIARKPKNRRNVERDRRIFAAHAA